MSGYAALQRLRNRDSFEILPFDKKIKLGYRLAIREAHANGRR
jgi:hypothetical protein